MSLDIITSGVVTVDLHHKVVLVGKKQHELTPRSFDIITYLAEAQGRPVSAHELAEKCFPRPVFHNTAEVYIKYIRDRLGKEVIINRQGFGYVIKGAA